jgi:hypothetical protein
LCGVVFFMGQGRAFLEMCLTCLANIAMAAIASLSNHYHWAALCLRFFLPLPPNFSQHFYALCILRVLLILTSGDSSRVRLYLTDDHRQSKTTLQMPLKSSQIIIWHCSSLRPNTQTMLCCRRIVKRGSEEFSLMRWMVASLRHAAENPSEHGCLQG